MCSNTLVWIKIQYRYVVNILKRINIITCHYYYQYTTATVVFNNILPYTRVTCYLVYQSLAAFHVRNVKTKIRRWTGCGTADVLLFVFANARTCKQHLTNYSVFVFIIFKVAVVVVVAPRDLCGRCCFLPLLALPTRHESNETIRLHFFPPFVRSSTFNW